MRLLIITAMLVFASAFEIHPEETHDHKQLSEDLESLHERLDCGLGRKPCNRILKTYVEQFSKALETECAACKPDAKKFIYAFLSSSKKYFPEDYMLFVKKFDPEGKYMDKLIAVIANA